MKGHWAVHSWAHWVQSKQESFQRSLQLIRSQMVKNKMNKEGKDSKKNHSCFWFFWIGDSGSRSEVGKGNKQERKAGTSMKWAWGVNTGKIWVWKEWPNNTVWRNLDQTLGNTICVYRCLYFSTTFYRFFSAVSLHGWCLSSALLIGCVLFTRYFSLTIKNNKTSPFSHPVQQGIFANTVA